MENEAEIRIRKMISTCELERRWKAVREAMKERKLDYLIMQSSSDYLGGYMRYFTDIPTTDNYTSTLIFPKDEGMTIIFCGARTPAEPATPPGWATRGVSKGICVPLIPSLEYSSIFDAEKVVEELAPRKDCRMGLVGMGLMSASFYKYINEHLTSAKFENATNLVDNIKAIKSDEEIENIREAAAIQDAAFEYVLKRIRPGMRDYNVYMDAWDKCHELGTEQGIIMVCSAPAGTPARARGWHYCNRMIEYGDQITFMIETNNACGLYTEIMRTICIGKIPPELEKQFEVAQQAQKMSLAEIKPNADVKNSVNALNEFLRSKRYPEERRIHAHGQGYDLVERPSIDPDETMKIQARMNIAVHPSVDSEKARAVVCENYLIHENGEKECLHKTPQKIFIA